MTSWTMLDTKLHINTDSHRKQDGTVVEKETAREHRRVASPKAVKVEPKGKAKCKGKKG